MCSGEILLGLSEQILPEIDDDSVDLICTDPPYGISFMGKEWDKALPNKKIWSECLRVLKPGAFAFVMCIPRADCLWRMMRDLELAGFVVKFTPMYWTYASGFPKTQNVGKVVDRRKGLHRKHTGNFKTRHGGGRTSEKIRQLNPSYKKTPVTLPASPEAKALEGSYGGFQPKPAVEVIIVAMKPLSEKTFVEQALKNRKGVTWLDDCRIPLSQYDHEEYLPKRIGYKDGLNHKQLNSQDNATAYGKLDYNAGKKTSVFYKQGRFPANLLVSDDVLNDGIERKSSYHTGRGGRFIFSLGSKKKPRTHKYDSGSFSRYNLAASSTSFLYSPRLTCW